MRRIAANWLKPASKPFLDVIDKRNLLRILQRWVEAPVAAMVIAAPRV